MPSSKSDAHRSLLLTSPLMTGPDVKALQVALNKRGEDRGFPDVATDGEYGRETDAAVSRTSRALGSLESTIAKSGATIGEQRMIRNPGDRSTAQLKRARDRKAAADTLRSQHGSGGKAALSWARSQIGVHERPAGSNLGKPQPEGWERAAGFVGGPWCGAFAKASAAAGGAIVTPEARYVPWLENHARAHTGGYDGWQSSDDFAAMVKFAEPGDHVCFDFGGAGDAGVDDHVGVLDRFYRDSAGMWRVKTVDGNTGGDNPADGGMVDDADRSGRYVAGLAKVRWPSA